MFQDLRKSERIETLKLIAVLETYIIQSEQKNETEKTQHEG